MKSIKLNKQTIKKIDKAVEKIIKEYGCVLLALQWDDEGFIKDCEKTGHKLFHDIKIGYSISLNY